MPTPNKKPIPTHFLSLPLTTTSSAPQWQAALQHFSADIQALRPCPPSASASSSTTSRLPEPATRPIIPVKAIRPVGTLHLTVGVMSLLRTEEVDAAVEVLRRVDVGGVLAEVGGSRLDRDRRGEGEVVVMEGKGSESSSSYPPLTLSFTGFKSMRSPASTSFLYTPPEDMSGRLYPFCQALRDGFTREKLMVEETRAMKLHATVLNTIYAGKVYPSTRPAQAEGPAVKDAEKEHGSEMDHHEEGRLTGEPASGDHEVAEQNHAGLKGGHSDHRSLKKKGKRRKQAVQFDARDLLERYVDFEWARDVKVEKVAICEMGTKKMLDENGEVVGEEYTEIASVPLLH
ncbi:MAG: hypothetical protein Q9177_002525 [Variospora cf. flavescens]